MAANSSSIDVHSYIYCLIFAEPSSLIFSAFCITNILFLLSLSILIICLGLQRSTSAAASHSDAFTYHMVAMEMVAVIGFVLTGCSIYRGSLPIFFAGYCLSYYSWYGEMFFHMLTCVERYLAVVHPVTYRGLRGERGIRIRNISIGCVWCLCCVTTTVTSFAQCFWMEFWLIFFSLIIISFCSLSVLLVLIRPGPGEQVGDRERVDQSKRRAFYTILAILGVLAVRCCCNLVISSFNLSTYNIGCVMIVCELWFNLPSSLVLPLLFLLRTKTLSSRNNAK